MRASAAGTPPAEGADLGRPLPTAIVASAAPGPPSLASPPPDDPDDNPSLLDIVVRRPRLLLVGAVLFGLLGVLYVGLNWTSYQATARLVLRDPWEACFTLGTQWQFKPTNEEYKDGTKLIEMLIETRAKGGSRRMIESAVMLLPEPDSPTIPTVYPTFSCRSAPCTATNSPLRHQPRTPGTDTG